MDATRDDDSQVCLTALHPEHASGIAAEDGGLLLVGEAVRRENTIDGVLLPWNRMVGPQQLICARADLGHQMPKRFRGEDQRDRNRAG